MRKAGLEKMREQLNQRLLDLESEQEAANGDVQRAMEQLEELSNELHEAREGQTTEQADEALEEAVWEPQLVIEATSPTSVAIVLGGKQSAPAQQQPRQQQRDIVPLGSKVGGS